MLKKKGSNKKHQKLPDEVLSIINRKLRHLRREQEKRLVGIMQAASTKLHRKMFEDIKSGSLGRALITVPVSVYSDIIEKVITMTKEWPEIVWEAIESILEKGQIASVQSQELNAIVDEHAWPISKHPFTLDYIESKRFKKSVHRDVRRLGIDDQDLLISFDSRLSHEAAKGEGSLINIAWHERERIGIAIDEYVVAQHRTPLAVDQRYTPSNARREARKLDTQAMYKTWRKAYRNLKKKNPHITDVWCSQKIAKMDIARGRNAETIRKNMKK